MAHSKYMDTQTLRDELATLDRACAEHEVQLRQLKQRRQAARWSLLRAEAEEAKARKAAAELETRAARRKAKIAEEQAQEDAYMAQLRAEGRA